MEREREREREREAEDGLQRDTSIVAYIIVASLYYI